jgi:predicted AAA+ superfamily ATPase
METIDRFIKKTRESFFLFGPRGTGKSTWIEMVFKNAMAINLLEPDVFRRFAARPEILREMVRAQTKSATILIDEVQKVPEILDVVHLLIEENRDWQFILTGSSARKLKRTGVDLLAGRATLKTMHPFMAAELRAGFDLDEALKTGLLPVICGAKNPWEALKSYTALYLKEEVQMEGLVRNIGAFARFLEVISFSHAAVLNISNIARDCEIERKTVEGYISVLEDLLLAFKLPVFPRKAKRQLSEHPKLICSTPEYFNPCDRGVRWIIRRRSWAAPWKGWWRSTFAPGPLTRPAKTNSTSGGHAREWRWTSWSMGKLVFGRSKSKTPPGSATRT